MTAITYAFQMAMTSCIIVIPHYGASAKPAQQCYLGVELQQYSSNNVNFNFCFFSAHFTAVLQILSM